MLFKVVSYNVHSCVGIDSDYSVDRISDVLSAQDASVVCLQEIESNRRHQRTRVWSSSHRSDQPRLLASLLSMEHCIFAPAIRCVSTSRYSESYVPATEAQKQDDDDDDDDDDDGDDDDASEAGGHGWFGIAILSRYPILETRRRAFARYGSKTPRNAVACRIALPATAETKNTTTTTTTTVGGAKSGAKEAGRTSVWIVNTHLGCHWGGEQYRQASELSSFVESLLVVDNSGKRPTGAFTDEALNGPCGIILCGDFNSPPFFRSVQTIKSAGFIDAWESKGLRRVGGSGRSGVGVGVGVGIDIVGNGCTFPSDGRVPGLPSLPCRRRCRLDPFLRLDYIFVKIREESDDHKTECGDEDDDHDDDHDDDELKRRKLVLKCAYVVGNDGHDLTVDLHASDHLPLCAIFEFIHDQEQEGEKQRRRRRK